MLCLLSDQNGNIYVSAGNVRRIDKNTGIITRIAGNDVYGYNGENVLADTTSITVPYAMGFDSHGNLYLAEGDNNRIRKIDSLGYIHTVVGTGMGGFNGDGFTDTTEIFLPEGVAFDSCDNLYFNDLQNFRIRKVTFNPNCSIIDTATIVSNLVPPSITILPNPAHNQMTVSGLSNTKSISIINALGQMLITKQVSTTQTTIDISGLKEGVYILSVKDLQTGVATRQKFIKE